MWARCLGFALLVWIPAALHAQQTCSAPSLHGGFYVSMQQSYAHGESITYSCDATHKPVVEGWWAISKCQNGQWLHQPQCIDKTACILPVIPNAIPAKAPNGWYDEGTSMKVTCKNGYKAEGLTDTANCENGEWSDLPVCRKRTDACTKPPFLSNAVIYQQYQEVFPETSKVRYQCREGYGMDKQTSPEYVCKNGTWEGSPECKRSTDSGSKDKETSSAITTTDRCGEFPFVPNGDFIADGRRSLKFQCKLHFILVGPEEVVCYSNGHWSNLPTCRANYCSVNTADYPGLLNTGVKFITNGDTERLDCKDEWTFRNYALVECENGKPIISKCCNKFQINTGGCWILGRMTK